MTLTTGCTSLPINVLTATTSDCNSLCFQSFVMWNTSSTGEAMLVPFTTTAFTAAQTTAIANCSCGAVMVNAFAPFTGGWDQPGVANNGAVTITATGSSVSMSVTPSGGSACALTYTMTTGSGFGAAASASATVRASVVLAAAMLASVAAAFF
jgi:hypothetical protein